MEQKFKEYRKYDWTLSDKWQTYLNNIFPTPARDKLEKIRRRWYKANIDKEFDVEFEPAAASENKGAAGASGNAYQNYMNQ